MNESGLTFVTLNIERSKHIDRIVPFLTKECPDVWCAQEVCELDIPRLQSALGVECVYAPMVSHMSDDCAHSCGTAIFSRLPIHTHHTRHYAGNAESIPEFSRNNGHIQNRHLIVCEVEKGGELYRIGTTHFTWTPDGEANEMQRRDCKALLSVLKEEGEIVFMGDFNAPRGGEVFDTLAHCFTDNVPAEYSTSIDGSLHRAGQLPYMVDGIFSTPLYSVQSVRLICGLSDHCALAGSITKTGMEQCHIL